MTAALALMLFVPALAPAGEPPPPADPGQLPPPATGAPPDLGAPLDAEPPTLALSGRRHQRVAPVLVAYALCDERCEFEASARAVGVRGVGPLRVVTPAKAGDGGTRMRFEIRLSPRALKLIRRALDEGARVRIEMAVSAYDLAENRTDRAMRIGVRPEASPPRPLKRS